jgi:hypothetical protein
VAHAVRASMALPIIFPSVEIDGRRLVDGVISDPLPLAAAADARVVVTLGFAGAMPRRIDRLSRMVAQTSTTLINNLMDARIAVARASGQRLISIDLQLGQHIGLWDTSAMPYLADAGWRACDRELPAIVAALEGLSTAPTSASTGASCRPVRPFARNVPPTGRGGDAEAAERAGFMLLQDEEVFGKQIQRNVPKARELIMQCQKNSGP